jgi:gliding motility associated protien GldN
MKKYIFISNFVCASFFSLSQGSVGPSNVIIPKIGGQTQPGSGVIDGVYEKKDVLSKKRAIPYEYVRENDYVWGKRTWSYIDLREKINHPLYYPLEEVDKNNNFSIAQGRYSLYYILVQALRSGQLMGYFDEKQVSFSSPVAIKNGDDFSAPAARDYSIPVSADVNYDRDIMDMIATSVEDRTKINPKMCIEKPGEGAKQVYHKKGVSVVVKSYLETDTKSIESIDQATETFDMTMAEIQPGTTSDPAVVEYTTRSVKLFSPAKIIKYKLKEDWFFDKERSILDVRTIGLGPVAIIDSSSMQEKVLFWVYFPQARDVLKNYYVYDPKSTVGGNTFDHLFMTRRFNAVVYKESTLYDRKIEDYRFGADALYESEKVKNTIRTFEHDVWNF